MPVQKTGLKIYVMFRCARPEGLCEHKEGHKKRVNTACKTRENVAPVQKRLISIVREVAKYN